MKVDTLIVGFGIAGMNYSEQLRRRKKSFVVMAPSEKSASHMAAGIINPTVLKRFKPVWKAEEFLNYALPFYAELEALVQTNVIHLLPIHRILDSIQEQNEWGIAASVPPLDNYLNKELVTAKKHLGIVAPFAYGELIQTARVDNEVLLALYQKKMIPDQFVEHKLNHQALEIHKEYIKYHDIQADKIVFCEGYQGIKNPYFNYLPLMGSKGEILVIECDTLNEEVIFKGPIFLSPIGEHKFWVGATFDRVDKTTQVTEIGKHWLLSKLNQFLKSPFQILQHKAQIRATVSDRRPLLGRHPRYHNVYVLNGVGTRGVLMSPLLSHWLFEFIENNQKLPPEADIKRFENKYFRN